MKFSIEFNSAELVEVINNGMLLALAETASKTDTSALAAAKIIRHEKPSKTEAEKEPVQESIEDLKLSNNTKPDPEPETPSKKETKTYTLIEVRNKLASLSREGKQAQVKALIEKFGATKLSEVKEEDYAALMQEAEGL